MSIFNKFFITLLKFYKRFVSLFLKPACCFYPSCSIYAIEALTVHGMIKGSFLTIKRLCRCHPFNKGGVDLVPK